MTSTVDNLIHCSEINSIISNTLALLSPWGFHISFPDSHRFGQLKFVNHRRCPVCQSTEQHVLHVYAGVAMRTDEKRG